MAASTLETWSPGVLPDRDLSSGSEVASRPVDQTHEAPVFDNSVGLTDREIEIVRLVATGLSNEEVSGTVYVSVNTVKSYIRSGYRKMQVRSRSQAVVWAFNHGLVVPVLTEPARALQNRQPPQPGSRP